MTREAVDVRIGRRIVAVEVDRRTVPAIVPVAADIHDTLHAKPQYLFLNYFAKYF